LPRKVNKRAVGSARIAKWCDLSGAVVWRRFWRPAAARTGPCGQPFFSAGKKCATEILKNGGKYERCPILCRSGVAVRLLPGSCPAPARFLPGSCPAAGCSCPVPASPVPARFLPDGRARQEAGSASRSGGSCAGGERAGRSNRPAAASLSGAAPRMCGCFLLAIRENGALYSPSLLKLTRPQSKNKTNKKQARVVTVD
jgi:hypothetical protein